MVPTVVGPTVPGPHTRVLLELLELDDDCVPSLLVDEGVPPVFVMTQFELFSAAAGAGGAVTVTYRIVTGGAACVSSIGCVCGCAASCAAVCAASWSASNIAACCAWENCGPRTGATASALYTAFAEAGATFEVRKLAAISGVMSTPRMTFQRGARATREPACSVLAFRRPGFDILCRNRKKCYHATEE